MSCFRNCFPCFEWMKEEELNPGEATTGNLTQNIEEELSPGEATTGSEDETNNANQVWTETYIFTFQEVVEFTDNFNSELVPGQGGLRLGTVHKGVLNNQFVVVTRMDKVEGVVCDRDFMGELLMLNYLNHPNIVKLIGTCVEGQERLLVHEFMPLGSLEDQFHAFPRGKKPMDWRIRMNIAVGIARGLHYLHHEKDIIYKDLRPSNILLDGRYQPKLSQFGFAELVPVEDLTRRDDGYCPHECVVSRKMTKKSDIYSFGVILLELIAGRKAIEYHHPGGRNLVLWARMAFEDRWIFELADPSLKNNYPQEGFLQALRLACSCTQDEADKRPPIGEVVNIISNINT